MTVSSDLPQPPPPKRAEQAGKRANRTGRIWAGIGIAMGGHLLTILIGWLAAVLFSSPGGGGENAVLNFIFIAGAGQIVLAIAALAVGIILTAKGRGGGIGAGILIGWAVGLIVSAVIGFGVCVWLLNNSGPGGIG